MVCRPRPAATETSANAWSGVLVVALVAAGCATYWLKPLPAWTGPLARLAGESGPIAHARVPAAPVAPMVSLSDLDRARRALVASSDLVATGLALGRPVHAHVVPASADGPAVDRSEAPDQARAEVAITARVWASAQRGTGRLCWRAELDAKRVAADSERPSRAGRNGMPGRDT